MHETSIIQKLIPSLINVFIIFVSCSPLLFVDIPVAYKKIIVILVFFIYNLVFVFLNGNRDIGMIVVGSHWKEAYPVTKQLIYIVLYTLSFASLMIRVYFPLDVFLANMILLQLPTILLTGTTFHGFLAGNMVTVIK